MASATRSTTAKALITPEMTAAVDAAKAKIISGEITVHDYTSDSACPVK